MVVQVNQTYIFLLAYINSSYAICFQGVGKSATIKAVAQQAEKILTKRGDQLNQPRVLLCAWTGKASHLIGNENKSHILCIAFNLKSFLIRWPNNQ